MAPQPAGSALTESPPCKWTLVIGEVLLLKREPTNVKDSCAVAVLKDGEVVSSTVSHFKSRDCNKAFTEVTGNRINRGGGYGVEVPSHIDFADSAPSPAHYVRKWR